MTVLQDISTFEDIKLLVNTFYDKVQKDDFIGPIFNEKIGHRWRGAFGKNVSLLADSFIRGALLLTAVRFLRTNTYLSTKNILIAGCSFL